MNFGFVVRLLKKDNLYAVYEYGAYKTERKVPCVRLDGRIVIHNSCFKPREKVLEWNLIVNAKNRHFKVNTLNETSYSHFIKDGRISVKNCSEVWKIDSNGIDIAAYIAIDKLLQEQKDTIHFITIV